MGSFQYPQNDKKLCLEVKKAPDTPAFFYSTLYFDNEDLSFCNQPQFLQMRSKQTGGQTVPLSLWSSRCQQATLIKKWTDRKLMLNDRLWSAISHAEDLKNSGHTEAIASKLFWLNKLFKDIEVDLKKSFAFTLEKEQLQMILNSQMT